MKKRFYLVLATMLLFAPKVSAIEDFSPIYLDPNTNTLFGGTNKKEIYSLDNYAEDLSTSSANIDVITREDIKNLNNPSLTEVLNFAGSVTTQNSNGSAGSPTSVRIRGTDRVRFMVDGIRADSPASTSAGFNSQFFLTDDMERIEIIKGPQGNVLGTNASGGAISVQTRRGRGPLHIELESGMGNYSSYKERFAIMGGDEKKDYYISTTWYRTSGGMSTSKMGKIYNDSYSNLNVVTNLGLRLLDNKADLRNVFRFSNAKKGNGIGYDNMSYSYYNDPNNDLTNLDLMEVLSFKHTPKEYYNYDVKFGLYHNRQNSYTWPDRISPDEYDFSSIISTRLNFLTQHNFKYKDWNTFTIGYNFESEFIDGDAKSRLYDNFTTWFPPYPLVNYNTSYSGSTIQNDIFVNDVINIKDILFIRGGARLINNSQYGTYVTPNVSAALVLPTFKIKGAKTKFRGSWGQSVNTPTLYQRYGMLRTPYMYWTGNNNLEAEKFQSWDVGIEQSFFDEKLKMEFGYFNSNYNNYISAYYDTDPITCMTIGKYINISSARIYGYEAKATWEPNEKFKMVFSYTYTGSEDKDTGYDLPATPKNRFSGMAYWTPVERFTMYAGVETASRRTLSSASDRSVPGYIDAKIGANLRLFTYKGFSAHLRANIYNLFNQKICVYSDASNGYYYAPKINFMAGLFLEYNMPEKERI